MTSVRTAPASLTLLQRFRLMRKRVIFWKNRWCPNSQRAILTAYEIGETTGYEHATAWAERHHLGEQSRGIHILRATRDKADSSVWVRHVNAYLEQFDVSPLTLDASSGGLIHRLRSGTRRTIHDGPTVSVIMCAYNAQNTIEMAARSILQQSWRQLELLIVDDRSSDDTAQIAMRLAQEDSRVKLHVNATNVGPYVGRNLALRQAVGNYITCHDADDWAHPERLEKQIGFLRQEQIPGALSGMLRMLEDGHFVRLDRARHGSDGILKEATVSAIFDREAFDTHLGYWDSVRFGADTELVLRARQAFDNRIKSDGSFSMLTLEHQNSLTAHPTTGISEKSGMSETRKSYGKSHKEWRAMAPPDGLLIDFPLRQRPFEAPKPVLVPLEDILISIGSSKWSNGL